LPMHVGSIDPVARKAASVGKLAKVIHRWHSVACRQGNDPLTACVEERIGDDRERGYPQVGDALEGRVVLARSA
jgi:hypothetical protein